MSKVINMVGGGGSPSLLAAGVGTAWGNAEVNFWPAAQGADSQYFTINSNNEFICNKSGTYYIEFYHQAVFSASAKLIDTILRVKVNGTTIQTSTTSGGVTTGNLTVTLSAGDILTFTNVGNPVNDLSRPCGAIISAV